MATVLIVANETLAGAELRAAVEQRIGAGCDRFHVVVPVPLGPPPAIAIGLATAEVVMISDLDLPDQRTVATERLEDGLTWLRGLNCTADGEIAVKDAVGVVRDIVEQGEITEVLVSTLPSRLSRWLRQDLPSRIGRAVDVPVVVITPDDEPD